MIILCLLIVFPLTLGKCFEGETYPVNQLEQWTGYSCYDLKGNEYKPDQTILSCCGCIKLTCTSSQVPTNSYEMWTSFWKESKEATCCTDCHGKVFPIGSVISSKLLKDKCFTTVTKHCVSQSRGNESFARISDNYKSKSCCYDSTGVHPLGKAILDPKTCSSKVCSLPKGSLNGAWISSTKKCSGLRCDCCVHDGELVCDGGHITLPNGVNATCCDGMLMKPQNPDEDMTSTTTSTPITTTTMTSTIPAMTVVAGGDCPQQPCSSGIISYDGVCSSPNIPLLPNHTSGGKSVWMHDSTLMFCGGSQTYIGWAPNSAGWGATDICWKLMPGDTEWKSDTNSNMNVNRSWFSLNSIDAEEAVAAGGLDNDGTVWDTLEKYSGGEWKMMDIKLDNPTYGHCAVQYTVDGNSYLMIIGGSNTFNNYSNASASVTQIDLSTGDKVSVDPHPLPALWAPACTIDGEDIYVSGGGIQTDIQPTPFSAGVYRFNLKEGSFKFQGNLNTPRWGATMGVTGKPGQLVVAGGFYGTRLASIESSDDGGATWNTWATGLSQGVQYQAMASVPALTFKCE